MRHSPTHPLLAAEEMQNAYTTSTSTDTLTCSASAESSSAWGSTVGGGEVSRRNCMSTSYRRSSKYLPSYRDPACQIRFMSSIGVNFDTGATQ